YSVLALPASAGLFLLLSRRDRGPGGRPGFLGMSGLCIGPGLAPLIVWDAPHPLGGVGQLAPRGGLSGRAAWGSLWPVLAFLGGEAAVLGGIWWVAGITAIVAALRTVMPRVIGSTTAEGSGNDGPQACDRSGTLYLLCLWGVIWSACL